MYQNESRSYYDKYVFKVNRNRSKQHNTKCCLKRTDDEFVINSKILHKVLCLICLPKY